MVQKFFDVKNDDTAKLIIFLLCEQGISHSTEYYSRLCSHRNGVHSSNESWVTIHISPAVNQ
jgi:hypothetical protein